MRCLSDILKTLEAQALSKILYRLVPGCAAKARGDVRGHGHRGTTGGRVDSQQSRDLPPDSQVGRRGHFLATALLPLHPKPGDTRGIIAHS